MTDYGRPFVGSIKKVEDDWIDYNGHFNMAYYGVLFDRTCDEAFELVGLGSEYLEPGRHFLLLKPTRPISANFMPTTRSG